MQDVWHGGARPGERAKFTKSRAPKLWRDTATSARQIEANIGMPNRRVFPYASPFILPPSPSTTPSATHADHPLTRPLPRSPPFGSRLARFPLVPNRPHPGSAHRGSDPVQPHLHRPASYPIWTLGGRFSEELRRLWYVFVCTYRAHDFWLRPLVPRSSCSPRF